MSHVRINVGADNSVVLAIPQEQLLLEWHAVHSVSHASPIQALPCTSLDSFRDAAGCGTTVGSALLATPSLVRVLRDFGFSGSYRILTHGGKAYVVFNGRAGLRTFLRGTRYLATNPKMVSIAAGKVALRNNLIRGVRAGGILTIVVSGAAEVLDQIAAGRVDLTELGITIASDIVKFVLATGFTYAAAAAAAASGVVVLPGAVLLVGAILIGAGLEYADQYLGITENLKAAVNEYQSSLGRRFNRGYRRFERELIWHFVGPRAYNALFPR